MFHNKRSSVFYDVSQTGTNYVIIRVLSYAVKVYYCIVDIVCQSFLLSPKIVKASEHLGSFDIRASNNLTSLRNHDGGHR